MHPLSDHDERYERGEDPRKDPVGDPLEQAHADLRAHQCARHEEQGRDPRDPPSEGVGGDASTRRENDRHEGGGRRPALIHPEHRHEGRDDDQASAHAEEAGEESCGRARQEDEGEARRSHSTGRLGALPELINRAHDWRFYAR